MRVLVAEDDEVLAKTVAVGLRREGMAVDIAHDGDDALTRLGVSDYDVVVLDRDLPGTHGDDICRTLLAERSSSRVLMLTAASTVKDRVEGLGLGADDYLPKPFEFAELVARIRAVGRRPATPAAELASGDLSLDPAGESRSAPGGASTSPTRNSPCSSACSPRTESRSRPRAAQEGLGRRPRPLHHDREDDHPPTARQARRPAPDRDSPRERLPDRRHDGRRRRHVAAGCCPPHRPAAG